MPLSRTTPLFFDATCLVAAAGSPTGGSGWLLRLCQRSLLLGVVSSDILAEAERNVTRKLPAAFPAYRHMLTTTPLVSIAATPAATEPVATAVNAKDAHVVAAALAAGAPYLLTLDQGLAREVNRAHLPIQALSPCDGKARRSEVNTVFRTAAPVSSAE